MITIKSIHEIREIRRYTNYFPYDEIWAIVRSIKNPGIMRQVRELSPSWCLFKKHLELKKRGEWDFETFNNIYAPVFLKELSYDSAYFALCKLLDMDHSGKSICLACFCPEEELCHRSIIGGILQYSGVRVNGLHNDYSIYGHSYEKHLL